MDSAAPLLVTVACLLVVLSMLAWRNRGVSTRQVPAYRKRAYTAEEYAHHWQMTTGGPERCSRDGHYGGVDVTHMESKQLEFIGCERCGENYTEPWPTVSTT